MGTFTGSDLINRLSARLRDTSNTGYPRATILNVINRVQDCVNVRLGLVHNTATFSTSNTALYSTSAIASDYAYPVQVFDGNNIELDLIPFDRLVQQDEHWLRRFGARPVVAAPVGRELLVISPIPTVPMTMTVRYVKHPTTLVDGAGAWDLPDEHVGLVLDLCEAVLLLMPRDFQALQAAVQRAAPALQLEDVAQIVRRATPGDALKAPPMPEP